MTELVKTDLETLGVDRESGVGPSDSSPAPLELSSRAQVGFERLYNLQRCYAYGDEAGGVTLAGQGRGLEIDDPVSMRLIALGGRLYLSEELPVAHLSESNLYLFTVAPGKACELVTADRLNVPARPSRAEAAREAWPCPDARQAAYIPRATPCYVVDYVNYLGTVTNNLVFQSGVTYFVSSDLILSGAKLTIEPGSYLKFATNAQIKFQSGAQIETKSSALNPAIFTSIYDSNNVGETISGYVGNPATNRYAAGFYFETGSNQLVGIDFRYANYGIRVRPGSQGARIKDCSFSYGGAYAVEAASGTATTEVRNCLFRLSGGGINGASGAVCVASCTFEQIALAVSNAAAMQWTIIENSLFASVSNVCKNGGASTTLTHNACWNSPTGGLGADVIVLTNNPFVSGPYGAFYLQQITNLVDRGTTNANKVGLYHYTTASNQVKETTNIVDIGFHYATMTDYDSDGLPDYQEDSDGDGVYTNTGDLSNWKVADTDGDGLNDGTEVNTYGTTPESTDTDGDGYTDGVEVKGGSDPLATYDGVGRLIRTLDPIGAVYEYLYNNADLVVAVSNAATGWKWRFAYDEEARLTNVVYPDGVQEARAFDPVGNCTQLVRGGVVTAMRYDELDNRTVTAIGGTVVESNRYDQLGRLVATRNADGLAATNVWDGWGQVKTRNWPGGLSDSFQYTERGLIGYTDRLGIQTLFDLDTLSRVVRRTDGASNAVAYAFQSNGIAQLIRLYDGNSNLTQWVYNLYGNSTNKTYADGSKDRFNYDALQRLTNRLAPSGLADVFSFDANGNLLSAKYGPMDATVFQYDLLNRATNMTDALGATRWALDGMGRIVSETGPLSGQSVRAGYDALGRLTNLNVAGNAWTYAYDSLSRITSVSGAEGSYTFSYLNQGVKKVRVTYPSGVVQTNTFDSLTRQMSAAYRNGTNVLLSIACGYDAADRRTNEVWSVGRNIRYGYDSADRLTSVSSTARPSDNASFVYDAAGNALRHIELELAATNTFNNLNQLARSFVMNWRTIVAGSVNYGMGTVTVNGATALFYPDQTYEATNLTVAAGTNNLIMTYRCPMFVDEHGYSCNTTRVIVADTVYSNDANGNLVADNEFIYRYDAANRLTNAYSKVKGTNVFIARYDGLGRRMEVVRDGTNIERYIYAPGSWVVLAVTDGANSIRELYTRGPDLSGTLDAAGGIGGLVVVRQFFTGGKRYYLHSDALGNVVMATITNGTKASTYRYSLNGRLLNRTGTFVSRFRYSSKEYDRQTHLYYFGYRYLNPKRARWLSLDPLAEADGINLYRFVRNSPLNAVDPLGLQVAGEPWMNDPMPTPDQLMAQESMLMGRIPGVSEYDDYTAMTDSSLHPGWRLLAGGSLFMSALSDGFLPNAGTFIKRARNCPVPTKSIPKVLSDTAASQAAIKSGWKSLPGGVRIKKTGNYWIKEVDPKASAFGKWWGKGSLNAQAAGLEKLGDMAPSYLFSTLFP